MFVLNSYYTITTFANKEKGVEISSPSVCIDISAPLVKFRTVPTDGRSPREYIVNFTSVAFVRADLVQAPTPAPPEPPSVLVGKL